MNVRYCVIKIYIICTNSEFTAKCRKEVHFDYYENYLLIIFWTIPVTRVLQQSAEQYHH